MLRKPGFWLTVIFLACLGLRLFFAFQSPEFSTDGAYQVIRQVEHIRETGLPLFNDPLLLSSSTNLFLPGYYYLLAIFSFILPEAILWKVLPNLLASLVVPFAYLLSSTITKNARANVLVALMVGFNPLFFSGTVNSLSSDVLIIPFLFLLAYLYLQVPSSEEKTQGYLLLLVALLFTSSLVVILVIGAAISFLFLRLERLPIKKSHMELMFFSMVLFIWTSLIVFKRPFLDLGISVIWQNIPPPLIGEFFRQVNILEAVSLIGILPLLAGTYALYRNFFGKPNRNALFIAGILLGLIIILWTELLPASTGMLYFAMFFPFLFGEFFAQAEVWFRKTRIASYRAYFILSIIVLAIFTSLVPSITFASKAIDDVADNEHIDALLWLEKNSKEDATILVPLEMSGLTQQIGKRTVIINDRFLSVKDAAQRYDDINSLYTSLYKTNALGILTKYGVDYVIFSSDIGAHFNVTDLNFIDERCFDLVYGEDVRIFRVRCRIGEQDA